MCQQFTFSFAFGAGDMEVDISSFHSATSTLWKRSGFFFFLPNSRFVMRFFPFRVIMGDSKSKEKHIFFCSGILMSRYNMVHFKQM